MADIHRILRVFVELSRWLALLRLLRQDAHAPLREVLDEPSVDDIEAVLCVALCPAMPCQSARLAVMRCLKLRDLCLNREAERLEAEARVRRQLRALRIVELDIGDIAVVRRPDARVNEVRERLRCVDASDDALISIEVIRETRQVVTRPIDFV